MKTIGVTGQVGSGKSLVLSRIKEEYDCPVLLADNIAAKLQEPGGICYEAVKSILPDTCILPDGSFDKRAVAELVFSDKDLLSRINRAVHPAVMEYIKAEKARLSQKGYHLLFLESAILLESGLYQICDEVWNITVNEAERTRRLKESRGYSDEKISQILKNQLSSDELSERCDLSIDNSGDIEETMSVIRKHLE